MNTYSPARLLLPALALIALAAGPGAAGRRAAAEIRFRKTVVDREFRSEGVAVADVNRDGKPDILAGNLWYASPEWQPHEIGPVQPFDGATGYSNSFLNFAADINGDGWTDQVLIGFPGFKAVWAENPKGKDGHWTDHDLWRSAGNESPIFADLLGDGTLRFVFPYEDDRMAWYEAGADPTQPFQCHVVSEPKAPGTQRFSHGLGVGDLNGDGRADILCTKGYWEAPSDRRSGPWKFVPASLGPDCAQMCVYDVDADGDNDVVTSSAHNIGVWWYEQRKTPAGTEFVQHVVDDSFSQSHSLVMADINRDGVMDFVTGKRFWAHGPTGDVRPGDPAVLFWFELKRAGGKVEWVRHEIDTDSGVGTQFVVTDLNGDGLSDVVTSNKKGVFCFEQAGPS